jgi:hypothetical protein
LAAEKKEERLLTGRKRKKSSKPLDKSQKIVYNTREGYRQTVRPQKIEII